MAIIKKYEISPQNLSVVVAESGGFDPTTKKMKPFSAVAEGHLDVYEFLDAITAATEAGVIDKTKFVKQLFATVDDFEDFVGQLSEYEYRLHDRWWTALAKLCSVNSEPGFITNDEVAAEMRQTAVESKQI